MTRVEIKDDKLQDNNGQNQVRLRLKIISTLFTIPSVPVVKLNVRLPEFVLSEVHLG